MRTRYLLSVPLCAVALIATSGAAFADCENHSSSHTTGGATKTVGQSSQYIWWSKGTPPTVARSVKMTVENDNISDDNCIDTWFDWATADDHYDARLVRDCADEMPASTGASPYFYYEPYYAPPDSRYRDVLGIQKSAACKYDKPGGTLFDCSQLSQNSWRCVISDDTVDEDLGVDSNQYWKRNQNGTAYINLSNYWDPNS